MEYVLFTNGSDDSVKAIRELLGVTVPFRAVVQNEADYELPCLVGPSGAFYGKSEIDFFLGQFTAKRSQGRPGMSVPAAL
jgi:hypothetical protein